MKNNILFKQMLDYETNTYTYIIADSNTKEAVIIDPVYEMATRDAKLIQELGLTVKYFLDTHVHADHIT
jgi:glyoxylase-like metal-dependent hydrolase (beta-lactamase superfamily II)